MVFADEEVSTTTDTAAIEQNASSTQENTIQDAPQEYFTPKGTNGPNAYNNTQQQYGNTQQQYNNTQQQYGNTQQQYNNTQNSTQQAQYGPVPPSYDRRFQNRGGTYNAANEASNQAPAEYGYTGSSNNYNPAYSNNNNNNNYNNNNIPNSYSNNTTSSNSNNPNFNWNTNNAANTSTGSIEGFPTLQAGTGFSVQVGSYTQLDNATRQAQSLRTMGLSEIYLSQSPAANVSGGRIYKIFAGRFDDRDAATIYASQIKRQFLVNGFVLRL